MHREVVEKAFELAKTGKYRGLKDIKAALRAQGYDQYEIPQALLGPSLTRELQNACRAAQGLPSKGPVNRPRTKSKLPHSHSG